MAPGESPYVLALVGALLVGVTGYAVPHLGTEQKAIAVCLNARPGETPGQPSVTRRGYGWGRVEQDLIVCLPTTTATVEDAEPPWKRMTLRSARDERGPLAVCAGLHVVLAAWTGLALARRRRELLATLGHDVPVEPRAGYREPARVRRVLPADEQVLWNLNTQRAAAAWSLSTAAVAWAGSGSMPVPMPWALALWSALTLPGAVAHVRWRGRAVWGVWLPLIGASALLVGSPFACAWVALVSGLCGLCAWSDERDRRRRRDW